MSRYQKNLGDFGETVAEKFYLDHGFRIIEKKYLVKGGELDLIVESNSVLVFVEVKTRRNSDYGFPAESINWKKKQHMRRAAEIYLMYHPTDKEIRFDAFEVYASINQGVPSLEKTNHIPNILF